MSAISLKNMWKRFYDPSLGQVETPQGVLSLPKLFLPFFLEMFLIFEVCTQIPAPLFL